MSTTFSLATWNPADKTPACELINDNLTVGWTSQRNGVRSTVGNSTGKWYFESTGISRTMLVGLAGLTTSLTAYWAGPFTFWAVGGGGTGPGYSFSLDGAARTYGYYPAVSLPATSAHYTVGVAVDFDAHTVDFYVEGIWRAQQTIPAIRLYAFAVGDTDLVKCDGVTNFGQSAFIYGPPSGYYAGFGEFIEVSDAVSNPILPGLSFFAENTGPTLINIPMLQLGVTTGATSNTTLPMLGVGIRMPGNASATLPMLGVDAVLRSSLGENDTTIDLPGLSASASGAGNASLGLPFLSSAIDGTVTSLADAPLSLPGLTSSASGKVSGMVTADIGLPSFSSVSYSGAVCSIVIDNQIIAVSSATTPQPTPTGTQTSYCRPCRWASRSPPPSRYPAWP